MDLVEIRDLDGPNLFRLEPVIKIGLDFAADEDPDLLSSAVASRVIDLHRSFGESLPRVTTHIIDDPYQRIVAFDWNWRRFALGVARLAADETRSIGDPCVRERLNERLERDRSAGDTPQWVRDSERTICSVGITGTNGKTTTTRLLAHIGLNACRSVGWSSSTGVYINGELVLEGDYSGPSGARRVLQDPNVELGILETARGGLLLRGLAYESNDVGVFLNVSADHLSLQGVETIETLAEVKSVVVRVTRSDGLVVLNADDPLVLRYANRVRAPIVLISQKPESEVIQQHIASGELAIVLEGSEIVQYRDGRRTTVAMVGDIPITFGGAAPFMIENAMAVAGAALGLGFDLDQIASGLRSFRNDSHSNKGRLNIFDVEGRVAIIDYAHNDIGLQGLATFSHRIAAPGSHLHLIIGTAGDRRDEDFLALGRVARAACDAVYLKDTPSYLRGREPGEMPDLMRKGFLDSNGDARLIGDFEDELAGFIAALEGSSPGDVIAVMSQADQDRIMAEIQRRGGCERTSFG